MAFEHTRGTQFIKARLAASSAVTAPIPATRHFERARDIESGSTQFPYITITPINPRPRNALNSTRPRFLVSGLWDVKVTGLASDPNVEAAANAVDDALQATHGPAGLDGYVYGCVQEGTVFDYAERAGGNLLRHIVGQYWIDVQVQ